MIGAPATAHRMLAGLLAAFGLAACSPSPSTEASPMTDPIALTSTAFAEGGAIPSRHTCDADDVSPPLAWSNAPQGTVVFAVIVDDPDASGWIHWTVADIPADSSRVAEGTSPGTDGRNDFGRSGWGGPCPPSGTHRYTFELFALSGRLGLAPGFSADALRAAMQGKVLASGRLSGTYRRGG